MVPVGGVVPFEVDNCHLFLSTVHVKFLCVLLLEVVLAYFEVGVNHWKVGVAPFDVGVFLLEVDLVHSEVGAIHWKVFVAHFDVGVSHWKVGVAHLGHLCVYVHAARTLPSCSSSSQG